MPKNNWLAVVGGVGTLLLIVISLYIPWWQFTVGNGNPPIAQASFSPVTLNLSIFSTQLSMPLIMALNISSLLLLLSGGIIMLIYAIKPNQSYSKRLLGFGYNKALIAVIFFVVELVILVLGVKTFAGVNFPLMGTSSIQLPSSMIPAGMNLTISVSAAFQWPFYFGIAVAAICVAARFYHRKIANPLAYNLAPSPPLPQV
jgi:hypothetical protein